MRPRELPACPGRRAAPRRRARAWLAAALALLALAAAPRVPAAATVRAQVKLGAGAAGEADVLHLDGVDYVSAADVQRWFGAAREWSPELGKLTLKFRGHVLRVTTDTRFVQWDGRNSQLEVPVIYRSSMVWLPVSAFGDAAPEAGGVRLHWDPRTRVLDAVAAAPAAARVPDFAGIQGATVDEVDGRTVLTLSLGIVSPAERLRAERGAFVLRFPGTSVAPGVAERLRPSGLIRSIALARNGADAELELVFQPDAVGYNLDHLSAPERWRISASRSVDALESGKLTAFQMPGTRVPARAARVILDPGHGGSDAGTVSGSLNESVIALDLARAVKTELEKDGLVTVILTRDGSSDLPQRRRAELANTQHGQLYVSLHLDGAPSRATHGFEVFSWPPTAAVAGPSPRGGDAAAAGLVAWDGVPARHAAESDALASDLQSSLAPLWPDGGRGHARAKLLPLEGVDMPAVMVECGVLTADADARILGSAAGQARIAAALADGIRKNLVRLPRAPEGTP